MQTASSAICTNGSYLSLLPTTCQDDEAD
jgi:hypothetical protein